MKQEEMEVIHLLLSRLLEEEKMGWQWHQLDHIEIICTLLRANDHAS